jgi:uncharacterized damage-inducible protein DinB
MSAPGEARTGLVGLVRYDGWANRQTIHAAAGLPSSRLHQPVAGSFPSLHETLVHILWAEELWLERWQGRPHVAALDPGAFPSLAVLGERLEAVHQRQLQVLAGADPDRTVGYESFQGRRWEYPLGQMVLHLVAHSAYHRGQAAAQLRQLGVVPANTDYLNYVDATS